MSDSKHIREISISEFFAKNRHLLGFDNPIKSLLTTVREAVDNSLDACEEAGIMPDIQIEIKSEGDSHFSVAIQDNGPGIAKSHLANIFGKLLYGSKFHRLRQSRGQQGIGISAAVMYGQMTTGRYAEIISKTGPKAQAQYIELQIDTKKNKPKVIKDKVYTGADWQEVKSGTKITIHLEGAYKEGRHGVLSYLSQSALSNPHASFLYTNPKGKKHPFPRVTNELPKAPHEIKRHPHGIELGLLLQFLHEAKKKTVSVFLREEFSRLSDKVVADILKAAELPARKPCQSFARPDAQKLFKAIQETKLLPPPTNCLSPLGEESLTKALYWLFVESNKWDKEEKLSLVSKTDKGADTNKATKSQIKESQKGQSAFGFASEEESQPEEAQEETQQSALQKLKLNEDGALASKEEGYFVTAVTRPPFVYRGNPFQVEVGLFYGKGLKSDGLVQLYRYANRVPLQYQASACAMSKAALSVPWKSYGLDQSRGALPSGPVVIVVHMASVWVPYTSESKEAIAHYPEILKEFRLALMECGRRLQRHLRHQKRQADEAKKRSYIEKYLSPIGEALQEILEFSDSEKNKTVESLELLLEQSYAKKISK